MKNTALQLILQAGYIVKGVLIILLFFSVVSWAIIFFKHRYFSKAQKETDQFLRAYKSGREPKELYQVTKNFTISPIANVFKSVYSDEVHTSKGEVKRMLRRSEALESAKLEKYLNFLAPTGSTTP